ncbi:cupin [Variovorax ureilyticus]|uniref:Cupin n=1 Tax=Variovorax ureilyticus TaxID=1836198 RepID=A0ABU8VBF8_9BURK
MSLNSLASTIEGAQLVLRCKNLNDSINFLTTRLGFKVRMIMPSEAPTIAVLSAHGCTVRLEMVPNATPDAAHLRLLCKPALLPAGTPPRLSGPDGMVVDLVDAHAPVHVPPAVQEFVLTRLAGPESWGVGRAGMLYRDLIPSRLNGRFVASHILLPQGGPVPDYVHYHRVRFQVIFCKAGWVRLVYEDQGDPFVLQAGDCVLQPPEIRHRVLESSGGAEVVEIGCPAIHETHGDPGMHLPTGAWLPERSYDSQKFVRHVAAATPWGPSRLPGFEARDTGISAATEGLGGVRVLRPATGPANAAVESEALGAPGAHQGEFLFLFVLAGQCELGSTVLGQHALHAGDSCVLPAGADYRVSPAPGLELLEVTLPARLPA